MSIITRELLASTRPWWDIHGGKPVLHCLVSLVLSQRVRFAVGRQLRQTMYSTIAPHTVVEPADVPAIIAAVQDQLQASQLAALHWIQDHSAAPDLFALVQSSVVPGIGPWTRKALGLMTNAPSFHDAYLHEDAWVAARASQTGLPATLRRTGHPDWVGHRGHVSLFLWRLTALGARCLAAGQPMTREHFL